MWKMNSMWGGSEPANKISYEFAEKKMQVKGTLLWQQEH